MSTRTCGLGSAFADTLDKQRAAPAAVFGIVGIASAPALADRGTPPDEPQPRMVKARLTRPPRPWRRRRHFAEQTQRIGTRLVGDALHRNVLDLGQKFSRWPRRKPAHCACRDRVPAPGRARRSRRAAGPSARCGRSSRKVCEFLNVKTPEKEIKSPSDSATSARLAEAVKQWSRPLNAPFPISSCRIVATSASASRA